MLAGAEGAMPGRQPAVLHPCDSGKDRRGMGGMGRLPKKYEYSIENLRTGKFVSKNSPSSNENSRSAKFVGLICKPKSRRFVHEKAGTLRQTLGSLGPKAKPSSARWYLQHA